MSQFLLNKATSPRTARGRRISSGAVALGLCLALAAAPACAQKEEGNNMFWLLLLLGGGGGGGGGGGAAGGAVEENSETTGTTESGETSLPTVSLTSDTTVAYVDQSSFTIAGECSEENRNVALSGAVIAVAECLSGTWSYDADLAWMPSGRYYLYLDHSNEGGAAAERVEAILEKNTLDEDATALYTFEDVSDAGNDSSLAGIHDAKKVSNVNVVDDVDRGRSLDFDGATGEFQLNDGKFFNDEFDARTISFWLRPRDLVGPRMLVDEGGSTNGMALRLENGELILAARTGGAGSQTEARAPLSGGVDEWSHIILRFDRGRLALFVDGADPVEATAPFSIVKKHSDVGGIGMRYGSDSFGAKTKKGQADYFDGRLDHVAVYDKAVSAAEAAMLAGLTPDPELLEPPGPLDIGLVARYEFDTAKDPGKDSAGGHQAVVNSVKLVDDPDRGSVARFKSASQFKISDGSFLNDEFTTRSVAFWFKPNKTSRRQTLYDEGGATNGMTVKIEGNRLHAAVRAGGTNSQETLSMPLSKGADAWYQALVVFDEGAFKLYLDGSYLETTTAYTTIPAHGNDGGAGARHGNSDAFGESGTDAFNRGLIDDLRIYNRALGDPESELLSGQAPAELKIDPLEEGLAARYNFDDADDAGLDSFGGHAATIVGVTVATDPDRESVGRFDGATSSFSLSDGKFLNDAFTDRSVAFWFKPTDLNTLQVLYDEGGTTNGLSIKIEAGELRAALRNGGSKKQTDLSATLDRGADVWYHAAVTFESGEFALYLGGVATNTTAAYTEIKKHGDTGGIGAVHGSGDAAGNPKPSVFNGDLDDFRIYDRALASGEVDTLAAMTGSTAPLAAFLAPSLRGNGWRILVASLVAAVLGLLAIQHWRRRQRGL